MRQIKVIALAVMGACILSMAMAAGASAQKFHASKTGNLKGFALNTQVFNTGSGNVECTAAASSGTVTTLETLTQAINVKYSGCKAFGFINTDISEAHYVFSADGSVAVTNTITITPLGAGCTVTVGPQTLKEVKFKNSGSKITEETNVKNIVSTSSGGLCGSSSTTGTYTGNNDIELEGGTISWS